MKSFTGHNHPANLPDFSTRFAACRFQPRSSFFLRALLRAEGTKKMPGSAAAASPPVTLLFYFIPPFFIDLLILKSPLMTRGIRTDRFHDIL